MTVERAARWCGILAFAIVELLTAFGSIVLATLRCCGAAPGGPIDAQDWAAVAIFAVVMIVPAGLIGCGVTTLIRGVAAGIAVVRASYRTNHSD